jgi:hypothetical protein
MYIWGVGTLFAPDSEVSSQTSDRPRARSSRTRSASEDEYIMGGEVKRSSSSVLGQDEVMSEFSRDDDAELNDDDDDDDDDDESFNSDDDDPLAAAVQAMHTSTRESPHSRRTAGEDGGFESSSNVFSDMFMTSYRDGGLGGEGGGGRKAPRGWRKSLMVATGSSSGQVLLRPVFVCVGHGKCNCTF